MALADPQIVTLNAASQSLPRVTTNASSATYLSQDGAFELVVSHQVSKAGIRRSLIKIRRNKLTTNPLNDVKSKIDGFISVTLTRPESGFLDTELVELFTALNTWGSAATNANYVKVIGLQS